MAEAIATLQSPPQHNRHHDIAAPNLSLHDGHLRPYSTYNLPDIYETPSVSAQFCDTVRQLRDTVAGRNIKLYKLSMIYQDYGDITQECSISLPREGEICKSAWVEIPDEYATWLMMREAWGK